MYAFAMGEAMGAVTSLRSTIRMAASFFVHRFYGGTPPGGVALAKLLVYNNMPKTLPLKYSIHWAYVQNPANK
jgi:hypothetical protein